jgi:hypothetical protein
MIDKAEIIIYKESVSPDFQIEVRVEDETVWLSQLQMAELFEATKQNISLHVNNVFKDGELEPGSTVKEYLTVQFEGKREVKRKVLYYNLDVIISVGYRVKSKRGIQFRIWANKVLKEYLLRGYALNNRIDRIEQKLLEHDQKFELIINTGLKPTEGIFYNGQIFDAWQFVSQLIKEAEKSIVLIDNYVDESVLMLLSKRNPNVKATIYTGNLTKQLETDLQKHHQQYPPIELKHFSTSHDRFLIIDETTVYHIGASLKDLGKKWFAFSRINLNATEMINKLNPSVVDSR